MDEKATRVLVVEDGKFFAKVLKDRIEGDLGFSVVLANSRREAEAVIQADRQEFFVALLDLNLPDANGAEIVDVVNGKGIPAIVFTGEFDESMREEILSKRVIDYVFKENATSIDYVVHLIGRIHKNRTTKVMVVDDSRTARAFIRDLLKLHLFQVVEAENGVRALEVLKANQDIRLALVDYQMPEMDGFQFIKKVRTQYAKENLAIIGLSAYGNNILSAKFIKNGANDFLNKPFLNEEFFCRVTQNIEFVEHVHALRDATVRDFLSGLFNRRFLFDNGQKLLASARRGQITLTVAMLDIDHFKKVNDTRGHDGGDAAIRAVARALTTYLRNTDTVARVGGEEFCILAVNLDPESGQRIFDELRQNIADEKIVHNDSTFQVTVSVGVNFELRESLDAMINLADEQLYLAKQSGRNQVMVHYDPRMEG